MTRERANVLWWLAVLVMICDHIGAWLLPYTIAGTCLRVIGRAGLCAWGVMTAEGWRHTSDKARYALRVMGVALVACLPYYGLTGGINNPVWSLLLGLMGLWVWEYAGWLGAVVPLLGIPLGIDPYMGAMTVIWGQASKEGEWPGVLAAGVFTTVWALTTWPGNVIGLLGLAIPLGALDTVRLPQPTRWWKYAVYPGHLLVLWGVRFALNIGSSGG